MDDTDYLADASNPCPACAGPIIILGQLGSTTWGRCRCCGLDCEAEL